MSDWGWSAVGKPFVAPTSHRYMIYGRQSVGSSDERNADAQVGDFYPPFLAALCRKKMLSNTVDAADSTKLRKTSNVHVCTASLPVYMARHALYTG
jgi:hypothetical protein